MVAEVLAALAPAAGVAGYALRARRVAAPESAPAPGLVTALEAIRDEPVPVLASHDLHNVHIPGSYADRVQSLAAAALEEANHG